MERAEAICRQADVITALTLDVLKGTTRAFDSSKSVRVFNLQYLLLNVELWAFLGAFIIIFE